MKAKNLSNKRVTKVKKAEMPANEQNNTKIHK